jgi:hypothetical protein
MTTSRYQDLGWQVTAQMARQVNLAVLWDVSGTEAVDWKRRSMTAPDTPQSSSRSRLATAAGGEQAFQAASLSASFGEIMRSGN